MNWIERFPWAKATIGTGLGGIAGFVIVALLRLSLGKIFPEGYDTMIWALVALTGVGGGVGVGKRATDYTLAAIKTGDAQTIASVVGPPKIPDADETAAVADATPVLTRADMEAAARAQGTKLEGEAVG